MSRGAGAVAIALSIAAACTPIEPHPLSNAPLNTCGCSAYPSDDRATLKCNSSKDRCEVSTGVSSRPTTPFFVVASVPDSAFYAPGITFVYYSDEHGNPAFNSQSKKTTPCVAPRCIQLGDVTVASGSYLISANTSFQARYPLPDKQPIPVRVEYERLGNLPDATSSLSTFPKSLPIDPQVIFPSIGADGPEFVAVLPSGVYRRILYPDPPFDALFPPRFEDAQSVKTTSFSDVFTLDERTLDPAPNRVVDVVREERLDGWRAWFAEIRSGRRVSTVRTLSGRESKVRLETSGQEPLFGSQADLELVVAPPDDFIAVPRYESPIFSGQTGGQFVIPFFPPPVPVIGLVAEPSPDPHCNAVESPKDCQLLGYAARLTFESATITVPRDKNPSSTLLHYTAELSTDDRGHFATLLPPGTYNVTTEPVEGTGFAKSRQLVIVDKDPTAPTLQPPKRTKVRGRVLIADQRPLSEAEVVATPQTPSSALVPKPRPARTRTQPDGRFMLDLDQGPYIITAIPKAGTGFPRVAIRSSIPPLQTDLADILVPPPIPLTFAIRDQSQRVIPVENVLVRIFAVPGAVTTADVTAADAPEAVEIGNGMTDATGMVEILLAPEPR